MKEIIVFAGSNSKVSINKQLAEYAASFIQDAKVTVLDLNNFPLPIFGVDLEKEHGFPEHAQTFLNHIKSSDGIILSLAEHNGAYTTVFKNLFDWMSRIESKLWHNKPMLLMATSPGARGGRSVLEIAEKRFPFQGGNIIETFSLPSFGTHFKDGKIIDETLNSELRKAVESLEKAL
ncbi:NADPH-dependent FMN reductase [Formosa haliotis]|uniref:NADPH-dependent FMN reductase n=1 Tax=Formosa haliotis TaxID=1555194 RepID=UPI000824B094|nr:NAD(P)H-dependent oxidoreductase [Formosa haliotis]